VVNAVEMDLPTRLRRDVGVQQLVFTELGPPLVKADAHGALGLLV
jgi:hypothetical protein